MYAIFNAKFLLRSVLSSIVNKSSLLSSLVSGVRGSLTMTPLLLPVDTTAS